MESTNPAKPTLGKMVGPFTEIALSSVDTSGGPTGIDDDKTRAQTVTGFTTESCYIPEIGKHVILTVKNNGQTAVSCLVRQNHMLDNLA